jgi:predicted ATPase/class 3 adenylate cyclase
MPELPTGTVTFLFADVEGSTDLLTKVGRDAYGDLLAEHRRLVDAAVADGDGRIVDTQGDAFFAAFPRASAAVACAARLQRELAETAIRVRIGLHTGQPALTPTGYVGLDVPRAARICAAAHGGQVLLSQTTRELVEDDLPESVALRDLGEHRLKDLSSPQRLTQLVIAGLPDTFPSLRTLENRPTNLPIQPTPLIGRERELETVSELLGREDVRLLTLTGAGGAGKTRLALQAAAELVEEFPQGVYLVTLEPVADPALLLPTISQTIGARETAALSDFLATRRTLIVLDNLEHLLEATPALSTLLAAAPQLKLLVTSRTPLHLSGEHELQVPPLELPDPAHLPDAGALSQYEAVELFVERARAVKADFAITNANAPAVAEICVRLDGLPLAIELAAARAKLLSPQALLARLEQRFDLLTGGPRDQPERRQTLRATIDWSYGLLGPDEQTLFTRLAVFAGGCTLEAAEAVCGDGGLLTTLSTLIDNNLIVQEEQPDGEPRFTMLETIHAYALELLGDGEEADALRRRHTVYFVALAERIGELERGSLSVDWPVFERELDNFRSALERLEGAGENELAVRLVTALSDLWQTTGRHGEADRWLRWALGIADDVSPSLRARVELGAAGLAWRHHDLGRARELSEQALELFRDEDDRIHVARALGNLGIIASLAGKLHDSDAFAAEAQEIFRELGHDHGVMTQTHNRALAAIAGGDYGRARPLLEQSLVQGERTGSDQQVGNALCDLGILDLYERRYEDAAPLFARALESALRTGWRINVVYSLRGLAATATAEGDLERAARLSGASDVIEEEIGERIQGYAARIFEKTASLVRNRLDEPPIEVAYSAGRAMSQADAVTYALATVPEQAPL